MKTFEIIPTVSCGNVEFLTERKKVRKVFGKCKSFLKGGISNNSADDFGFCHAYYNSENQLIAIEFFNEDIGLLYKNKNLFAMEYEELKDFLTSEDVGIIVDSNGLISPKLQIGITADENNVECILVAMSGYYDEI
jgi:hypothetical protein